MIVDRRCLLRDELRRAVLDTLSVFLSFVFLYVFLASSLGLILVILLSSFLFHMSLSLSLCTLVVQASLVGDSLKEMLAIRNQEENNKLLGTIRHHQQLLLVSVPF